MTRFRPLLPAFALLLLLVPVVVARAGEPAPPPPLSPVPAAECVDPAADPGPQVVVHVPVNEMDVLLQADRRGVVLRHAEYERLLEAARVEAALRGDRPPLDGALVSAEGTAELGDAHGVRFELTYRAHVLADRPCVIPFSTRGLALEHVEVVGQGRYEEFEGQGRLRFEGRGERTVRVRAHGAPLVRGGRSLLDVRLPPAAAMAVVLMLPVASDGVGLGEGPEQPFRTGAETPETLAVRPAPDGRLRVAWGAASRGEDGPPILDVETRTLHHVEDGLFHTLVAASVHVLRTPVTYLDLDVPPAMALRSVEGQGVTGHARSEDRSRLRIELDEPRRGVIRLTIDGETPYAAQPDVALPRLSVQGALRQRGQAGVRFGRGVAAHEVRVVGGRRLPVARERADEGVLLYEMARADSRLRVDLEPGDLEIEAASTYYLNLTEPAKSLIAAVTYRIRQGAAYRLLPIFPEGFTLRTLTINGTTDGFRTDPRPDGSVEVRLDTGVRQGGEIQLLATLEQTGVDWVPEDDSVRVPFRIPSAGVDREEGFVGIGADASFRVLDADLVDMASVGAAQLTARGVTPAGLVYGYRIEGGAPSVTLEVVRRAPRLEAAIVARVAPSPRRLQIDTLVLHRIERAGVRRLALDIPTWARDVVRVDAPDLLSASRDEEATEVPEGYDRWLVVLTRRALGNHALAVRYHEDQDQDDWSFDASRALALRVPLERVERSVVVERARGLEVELDGDLVTLDLGDLPPEVRVNTLAVRDVVRLGPDAAGPGVSVRKHDGAPTLDAVAPLVRLRTGVAAEGVLRTRAEIALVNVGLQFLSVRLPPGSELVGAVVDGESVKPLADPQGVLRIPVPPARRQEHMTGVALTYTTSLGAAIGDEVEIPAPSFPGLEVLKTTHEVAFDPGLEIRHVAGDYGDTVVRETTARAPVLVGVWHSVFGGSDRSAGAEVTVPAGAALSQPRAAVRFAGGVDPSRAGPELRHTRDVRQLQGEQAAADRRIAELQERVRRLSDQVGPDSVVVGQPMRGAASVETDNDLPYEESMGDEDSADATRPVPRPVRPGYAQRPDGSFGVAPGMVPPSQREPTDPSPPPPPPLTGMAAPSTPGQPPVMDPAMPGDWNGNGAMGGRRAGRAGPPLPGGEGPGRMPPAPRPDRPKRRKGLLSLDVPVLLSPNVLTAERLGTGGTIAVVLRAKDDRRATYWFTAILAFTVGLFAAARRGKRGWTVPLVGAAFAFLVWLVFGREGSGMASAVADAATLLAVVLVLRWIVRRRLAPAAAAAVLLAACLVAPATPARADELPPTEDGETVEAPRTVYVPYDPEDPTVPRPDDRVFLPLETYLHLRKLAHPDEDPELIARGRVVTLVSVRHTLDVGEEEATGEMRLRLSKRGEGLQPVRLPIGGLAVTGASLDGRPVRLLLREGAYHVLLEREGDHELLLAFRAPVLREAAGRHVVLEVPPFTGAALDLSIAGFDPGEVRVEGAARVDPLRRERGRTVTRVHLGAISRAVIVMADPQGAEPEIPLRTRAESHAVHSIRDGGTETRTTYTLIVLQGEAPYVDLDLPDGVSVLEAGGPAVARWETAPGRLRLTLVGPRTGSIPFVVRTLRPSTKRVRDEELPALAVRGTTGERGSIVVNADPFLRVEPLATEGLLRTATPRDEASRGPDASGRVAGAWRFAARPTRLAVHLEEAVEGLDVETTAAVAFGNDRVYSRFDAVVTVNRRVPVGELVFALPGDDEVRAVVSPALAAFWTEGEGEARTLHLRHTNLRVGGTTVQVHLERKLGGRRDGIAVPRWTLEGARRDRGRLVLFALADVDPAPGALPGLRSEPLVRAPLPTPPVPGATPHHAFRWEEPIVASLPVVLRTPPLEVDAVVVTSIHPGDDAHRLEHLVLFDIRRGATDRFDLFVPGGGLGEFDVVRTRDMREVREQRVTRRGPDDQEVAGILYSIRLQAPKDGLVEVTVSQVVRPDLPVRVLRPEGVKASRYFGLVGTFLDGEVDVRAVGVEPDLAAFEDLPFVPTGLLRQDVIRAVSARGPYVLAVDARRHELETQAEAVVRSAQADIVLGRDGQARVRLRYRLFNRTRQFLRVRLPESGVLFGVTSAGIPVKPLAGADRTLLVPVPKVPLGGPGYEVALLYRAPAGGAFLDGDLDVALPEILDVEVDRTVVRLYVPDGYDYDIRTDMSEAAEAEVAADLAEAAVREARDLLVVANSGTLEQRRLATDNAGDLVREANDLNIRAGAPRPGLDREVLQVTRDFDATCQVVIQDLQAHGRASQAGEQLDVFASNALPMLATEGQTDAPAQAGQQGMAQQQARWRYNPTRPTEGSNKQEFESLKSRFGEALEKRAQADQAMDFDVEIAQAENIARPGAQGVQSDAQGPQSEARNEAFDAYRNFALLNGALEMDQRKNRQLGVVLEAGGYAGQQIGLEPSNFTPPVQPAPRGFFGRNDPGLFFNDGEDGDYRARTEHVFRDLGVDFRGLGGISPGAQANLDELTSGLTDFIPPSVQLVSPDDVSDEEHPLFGAEGEEHTRPYGGGAVRAGLMGVDVSLPRQGRVFHFRGMRAGAPLRIQVSEQGTSPTLRWVIFLGVLALAAAGAVAIGRCRNRE